MPVLATNVISTEAPNTHTSAPHGVCLCAEVTKKMHSTQSHSKATVKHFSVDVATENKELLVRQGCCWLLDTAEKTGMETVTTNFPSHTSVLALRADAEAGVNTEYSKHNKHCGKSRESIEEHFRVSAVSM